MNHDLEKKLSALKIKPPSHNYLKKGEKILDYYRSAGMFAMGRLGWALAAALVLSMGLNIFQYYQSQDTARDKQVDQYVHGSTEEEQNSQGGYSIVQSDASPFGEKQNITITWGDSI
ncbi:hypothetical protein [Marinicella sp. W31]|uniref:hypothetical protein n=1 Tax=Marinicella sp. W31 TaxID=3023713 RepID=UPI003756DF6E